jgi:type VI secretion system protein ImpH
VDRLNQFLARHFARFHVFQLLRLLKRQTGHGAAGQAPIVRFRGNLAAGFPGHEFSSLELAPGSGGGADTVTIGTANFCVAGVLGALPEPYTEWLRDQQQQSAFGSSRFLDIFNHRVNTLRFALKQDLLPELSADSPENSDHAQRLAALMGLGWPELARQVDLPPRTWLALAALLADGHRSAAHIAHAFRLVYGAKARLEQWLGAWRRIEHEDRIALGGRNARLGQSSVLGRRVWDQQARVRIELSGWDYAQACAVLPAEPGRDAGSAHRHLRNLVWLLLDRQFDCEIRLRLVPRSVPASVLTARPDRARYWGLRLGQTAWLRRRDGQDGSVAASFLIPAYPNGTHQ